MKVPMLYFALLLCATALPLSAQSYFALYEGKEVNLYDGEVSEDLFVLQIAPNGDSSFRSYYNVKRDSVMYAGLAEGLRDYDLVKKMREFPRGVKDQLYYNSKLQEYTELVYGVTFFKTVEKAPNISYQFGDDTQVICGYPSEVATATLYGREWEVYYTNEVPIPYGPWKLIGLPGLVTQARSLDGAYSFKLIGFEKSEQPLEVAVPQVLLSNPVMEVSKDELLWIRKQMECGDSGPVSRKYSKGYNDSGVYHDKVARRFRNLSKRYQHIEK